MSPPALACPASFASTSVTPSVRQPATGVARRYSTDTNRRPPLAIASGTIGFRWQRFDSVRKEVQTIAVEVSVVGSVPDLKTLRPTRRW
jgi:hypothetical protein